MAEITARDDMRPVCRCGAAVLDTGRCQRGHVGRDQGRLLNAQTPATTTSSRIRERASRTRSTGSRTRSAGPWSGPAS